MNESMFLCQKGSDPKRIPAKCVKLRFLLASACAAASACALAKASSSALRRICREVAMDDMNRWMVVAPGAEMPWKKGAFWKRKGGTIEAQFQSWKAASISFRYFDRCHHFLHSGKSRSRGHVRTMDGCNMQKGFECGQGKPGYSSQKTIGGWKNMFLSFFPLNSCENKALLYYCIS